MASNPKVHPVINQIEVHPFNTQTEIRKICAKHHIAIEAYAPLVRGMRMKHPKIVELANSYGCSPAQLFVRWAMSYSMKGRLMLTFRPRWSLQHNFITLPKSAKHSRLIENVDINSFEISKEDMEAMNELDEGLVTDW